MATLRLEIVTAERQICSDNVNVLVADGKVYLPQPENLFRQGEAIHVLYHLYRPTPEDIEYASKGMQLGLLREGVPVSGFSAFQLKRIQINFHRFTCHNGLGQGSVALKWNKKTAVHGIAVKNSSK